MRNSALKNSGSFTGSPWALPLTSTVVPTPGTQSTEKLSPATSFFLAEKISAMRSVPGMDMLNSSRGALSCMPRVKSLPNSLASMSRSITTCIRLGPGAASTASGVPALLPRYSPAV